MEWESKRFVRDEWKGRGREEGGNSTNEYLWSLYKFIKYFSILLNKGRGTVERENKRKKHMKVTIQRKKSLITEKNRKENG